MNFFALVLGFILVVMGMANNLPNVPGLVELIRLIPGLDGLPRLSKYNPEYFFPIVFIIMMVIALISTSFAIDWRSHSRFKWSLGLFFDILMLATTIALTIVYLIEHDQVCLIDQFTGERAHLMAENESRAKEYMEVYGTVFTEETPDCQAKIGNWILPLLLLAITVYFIYIVRMWGFPIVAVALFITLYTLITSAVWYFDWSDNRYLTTAIGTISDGVRNYSAGVEGARNALISDSEITNFRFSKFS